MDALLSVESVSFLLSPDHRDVYQNLSAHNDTFFLSILIASLPPSAADTASAYVLRETSSSRANDRLMSVAGHLLQTKVTLAPGSNASVEFEWVPADGSGKTPTRFKMGGREGEQTSSQNGTEGIKKEEGDHSVAQYVF